MPLHPSRRGATRGMLRSRMQAVNDLPTITRPYETKSAKEGKEVRFFSFLTHFAISPFSLQLSSRNNRQQHIRRHVLLMEHGLLGRDTFCSFTKWLAGVEVAIEAGEVAGADF